MSIKSGMMGRIRNKGLQQRLRQNKREFYQNLTSRGNNQKDRISPKSLNLSNNFKANNFQNKKLRRRIKPKNLPSIPYNKSRL